MTDTAIWKTQRWFKKLPPLYKLAWKYITDMCDHAGIWKIDMPELLDDLAIEDFDLKDFFNCCNRDYHKKTGKPITRQRIIEINDEKIWITGFINFQYGGKHQLINKNNHAVKSALEILMSLNIFDLGLKNRFFHIAPSSPFKPHDTPLKGDEAPQSPLKGVEGGKEEEEEKENTTTEKVISTMNGSVPKENTGVSENLKREINGSIQKTTTASSPPPRRFQENSFAAQLAKDQMFFETTAFKGVDRVGYEHMITDFEIHMAKNNKKHPDYGAYKQHFGNYFFNTNRYLKFLPTQTVTSQTNNDERKRQLEKDLQETQQLENGRKRN